MSAVNQLLVRTKEEMERQHQQHRKEKEEEVASLTSRIASREKEIEELLSSLSEKGRGAEAELLQRIQSLDDDLREQQEHSTSMANHFGEQKRGWEGERDESIGQLKKMEIRIGELNDELGLAKDQLRSTMILVEEAQRAKETLEGQLKQKDEWITTLHNKAEERDSETQQLADQIVSLNATLSQTQQKLSESLRQAEMKHDEVESMGKDLERAQSEVRLLSPSLLLFLFVIFFLRLLGILFTLLLIFVEYVNLNIFTQMQNTTEATSKLEEALREKTDLLDALQEVKQRLAQKDDDVAQMREEIDRMDRMLIDRNHTVAQLQATLDDKDKRATQLSKKEGEKQREALAHVVRETARLQGELDAATEENSAMAQHIEVLEDRHAELTKTHAVSAKSVRTLEEKVYSRTLTSLTPSPPPIAPSL